jgi:hypothetical protein
MQPGPVVVIGVRAEDALQLALTEDEDMVEALSSNVPTQRSANAFALGALTGAFTTLSLSVRNTSSKGRQVEEGSHGARHTTYQRRSERN